MSDGDGMAALDGFIARLRALSANGRDEAAREAAPLVMAAARATAAAGTDPYGKPWRPRRDGKRAIPEAASAVDAVARGPVIQIRVARGAAIQHRLADGAGRRILPDPSQPLPPGILAALNEGARRAFEKAMG
jgi:hypothetical protein